MSTVTDDPSRPPSRRWPTWRGMVRGALDTAPLSVSFVPFGIAFGIAAVEKGIDPMTATLMSALVCGGASQFAALDVWTTPLPAMLVAVTVLVVNSRHLLYGAVHYQRLAEMAPAVRYPLLGMMTDSCFAYAVQLGADDKTRERDETGMLLGGGSLIYLSWIVSTAIGATLGSMIGNAKAFALDVVMVTYFAAVLTGMWQGRSDLKPWIAAAGGALLGLWVLPSGWHIISGALAGGMAGLLLDAE